MSKKKQTTLTPAMGLRPRASDKSNPPIAAQPSDPPVESDAELNIDVGEDDDSPVTMKALKSVLLSLQDNINKSTQDTIRELRQDVSEVKEKIDTSNERFEEAENRISALEDKIQVTEDVSTEVDTLRTKLETAIRNYDKDACMARKDNIIIKGIPGKEKTPRIARQTFNNLCLNQMKLSAEWVKEADIKEAYRFPAKNKKDPWPLFIRFGKSIEREDFFKATPNLKGTGIQVRNDLAPCLVAERSRLIVISNGLREQSVNYDTKIRDTSFEVWLEVKKPDSDKWDRWKE